jgi:hypothetical protein
VHEVRRQLLRHGLALHTDRDVDAGGPEGTDAGAGDERIGILHADHHPGDAGRDDRFDARRGTTVVVAGLERAHQRGTSRRVAGAAQRFPLGVRAARRLSRPGGEDRPVFGRDDGADPGVRRRVRADLGGGRDGRSHGSGVVRHHLLLRQ